MTNIQITEEDIKPFEQKKEEWDYGKWKTKQEKTNTIKLLRYISSPSDKKEYQELAKKGYVCLSEDQIEKIIPNACWIEHVSCKVSIISIVITGVISLLYYSELAELASLDYDFKAFIPKIIAFSGLSTYITFKINCYIKEQTAKYSLKIWRKKEKASI